LTFLIHRLIIPPVKKWFRIEDSNKGFFLLREERVSGIKTVNNIRDMQRDSDLIRREEKSIAFIPTMGFLHEGHLSLMKKGREVSDVVIASIFVNPAQFGPNEDLESYPKNIDGDLQLLEKEGVDIVFLPNEKMMYPVGFQTYVELKNLPNHLCGLSRPVFFRGVASVVAKLFNIVKPHFAVFGKKDYQQYLVIKQMVKDLNFDIEIIGAPIVREKDGLAMSSRNSYLDPGQRIQALCLYKSLGKASELIKKGERLSSGIIDEAVFIIKSYPDTEIDYIKICDTETLCDMEIVDRPALMALAVKVGKTRLIDNMILNTEIV
jgi:pantoate--beta-alanine ligase